MLLQRKYNSEGRHTHVLVKHTGASPEQNFSDRLILQWLADGVASIEGDTLTIKAEPQDLAYVVLRAPGYYCVSTGERIPVSAAAWARMKATGLGDLSSREAKAWLRSKGKAPTDYEVTNAYECVLADELHEKFSAVTDPKGRIVGAHRLEG